VRAPGQGDLDRIGAELGLCGHEEAQLHTPSSRRPLRNEPEASGSHPRLPGRESLTHHVQGQTVRDVRLGTRRASTPSVSRGSSDDAAESSSQEVRCMEAGAKPKVLVASTRSDSELVQTIPITRRPGQSPRVVMSLGKGRRSNTSLPDLTPGDRLDATAELEVTTDCEKRQPGWSAAPTSMTRSSRHASCSRAIPKGPSRATRPWRSRRRRAKPAPIAATTP
jgi:hypothetical protein